MKKFLLAFLAVVVVNFNYAQNAIPNPGFENWTNYGSYEDPDNWGTINSLTSIIGVKTCTKATGVDVHSGTYAMHLESKTVPLQGTAPGIAATGTINQNTQAVDGGVVYTKRPISLTGWYKYLPNGVDTGSVYVTFWKWNNGRVQVGSGEFNMTATVSSYTQFTVPINYTSSAFPDSMAITLLTSNLATGSPSGTKLFIDDLAFVLCNNFTATASATTTATCTAANGTANVVTTNGAGGNVFHWSNNTTNSTITATAGNYNVTVTDGNGCSATSSTTITSATTTITSTINATATTCGASTGTANVTPTNGTANYVYNWSNGALTDTILNLAAGAYQVTITDANGCSGTASTNVTTPNGPSATNTVANVTCHGLSNGAIDITTTGGTGTITYSWSNSSTAEDLTGLQPGTYTLTISDANNCSFLVSATITQPDSFVLTLTATDASAQGVADGTVSSIVTGGTSNYSYGWSNASTASDLSAVVAGNYCVTVTDANSCTVTSCATVSAPSGISNIPNSNIHIYPNPANSMLFIETATNSKFSFAIYGIDGKLMHEIVAENEKVSIEVMQLQTGFYTYRLRNFSSGNISYGKLQVQH